jgi:hypothetical protein
MTQLPACQYRVAAQQPTAFFCRHSKVRTADGIVSAEVCASCSVSDVLCANPRPVPEEHPVAVDFKPAPPRKLPPLGRRLWNAAVSLAEFVTDGCHTVTAEQYAERLETCDSCPERQNTRCLRCGCNLAVKARGRAFKCPLGKWTSLEDG